MSSDIFICHHPQESVFVTQLHLKLTAQGFSVYMDQENDRNDVVHRAEISDIIQASKLFILVQSQAALDSAKVKEELRRAEGHGKDSLLLVWQTAKVPLKLSSRLRKMASIDFAGDFSDQNFAQLVEMVRQIIPTTTAATKAPAPGSVTGGRRLKGISQNSAPKRAGLSPVALGAQIISEIVIPLELEAGDEAFITTEIRWLFSAIDHLQRLAAGEFKPNQPITEPIPPEAQTNPTADNRLLPGFECG